MSSDPAYRAGIEEQKTWVSNYIKENQNNLLNRPTAALYTIPVVVHVVHTGGAIGTTYNPTDAQIQSAIDYLNQVFDGTYPGTEGVGEIQINFVLANRDENCNPTTGINRVDGSGITNYTALGVNVNTSAGVPEITVKNLSRWNPYRYYNIWLVNRLDGNDGTSGSFIAGFAYFPGASPSLDGTIMLASQMRPNRKTLPHEIGHAFSLYHPFEDASGSTCPANTDCSANGDEICDTDPVTQPAGFVCRTGTNDCTGTPYSINTEHNYMNYTNCATLFTADQKIRMLAAAASPFRSGLATSWAKSPTYPVLPFTPPMAASCTPVTSPAGTSSGAGGFINFQINNRNLSSGNTNRDNGYLNAASGCLNLVELARGVTYPFSAMPFSQNIEQVRAWIDYNNNGIFETPAEQVFFMDNIGPPVRYGVTVNGSLTVPANAVVNTVLRMRVIEELSTAYGAGYAITSPCYNPVYGQAEDYPVMISAGSVLPVSYTSFNGNAINKDVLLEWKTASEKNNARFDVERSADGIQFQVVGSVKGLNASQGGSYSFRDPSPGNGIFFYRLKQVDIDGQSQYSAIRTVNINVTDSRNIRLLSNMLNSDIILQFNDSKNTRPLMIRLMDMSGKILLVRQIQHAHASNVRIDIQQLQLLKGIYLLQLEQGSERWVEKLVKF